METSICRARERDNRWKETIQALKEEMANLSKLVERGSWSEYKSREYGERITTRDLKAIGGATGAGQYDGNTIGRAVQVTGRTS